MSIELKPLITGKGNVIAAMRSGARFKCGGFANNNQMIFSDGSSWRVHGRTADAVVASGLVRAKDGTSPWSPMSTEYVLKVDNAEW